MCNYNKLLYDPLHPPILRHAIEDHYGELVLENEVNPNLHDEGLNDLILSRCDYLCDVYGTQMVINEIKDFILGIGMFPTYVSRVVTMRYVKNEYIKLLHQGHDPEDPTFKDQLVDVLDNDRSVHKLIVVNTGGYPECDTKSTVRDFIKSVESGVRLLPITKPYLDYVPTKRAKEILNRHAAKIDDSDICIIHMTSRILRDSP